MSVEALTIAAVVEEGAGALRSLYASGVSSDDFPIYDEEFKWCEKRLAGRKTLNRRVFRQRFPDFEWVVPKEPVKDLAMELKEERAFEEVNKLIATLSETLEKDNALELATMARERLGLVTRKFSPVADSILEDWEEDVAEMRRHMLAAKAGAPIGLKTGFAHLDHHMGGFMPGWFIEVLGRTGEGKSLLLYAMALACKLQNASVGIFTPELSRHEVKCRVHTLASARPEIKAALGLKHSFRNRALLFRQGFNPKSYEEFCRYFKEELPGTMHLLSGQGRAEQMTVGYIEDRIVELGLDIIFVDPIYLLKPVRYHHESNTYQEIAWIAEALHRVGETYNIPIVFSNQAHLDGPAGDAPGKEKSFGAKALIHLVDVVLGVKHVSDENRMIVRCSKARFGVSNFKFNVMLHANTGAIKEIDPIVGSYFNGKDDDFDEDDMEEVVSTAVTPVKGKTTLQKGKTHGKVKA